MTSSRSLLPGGRGSISMTTQNSSLSLGEARRWNLPRQLSQQTATRSKSYRPCITTDHSYHPLTQIRHQNETPPRLLDSSFKETDDRSPLAQTLLRSSMYRHLQEKIWTECCPISRQTHETFPSGRLSSKLKTRRMPSMYASCMPSEMSMLEPRSRQNLEAHPYSRQVHCVGRIFVRPIMPLTEQRISSRRTDIRWQGQYVPSS